MNLKRKRGESLPVKTNEPVKAKLGEKRKELLRKRAELPISSYASEIRVALRDTCDVMILTGETGSGKSTQIPQYLMDEPWCKGCIAVTQPRRVAATSLARRVAQEVGTPLGSASPASKVGYSVRFDVSVSPSTKIKYLTEGMLLQEMLGDPALRQYSAVIVDEVHERSVNVDLILGFLREIVTGNKPRRKGAALKVVVMSATADTEALAKFFGDGYPLSQAKTVDLPLESQENGYETEDSWAGCSSDGDANAKENIKNKNTELRTNSEATRSKAGHNEPVRLKNSTLKDSDDEVNELSEKVFRCHVEGRQFPVEVSYLEQPVTDFTEAAIKCVLQLHVKEPLPGDILVFLTGQNTIESVETSLKELAQGLNLREIPKLLILPLFAALPGAALNAVFQPTPHWTRKVILATNIAETSVTIPGVRFVIDCGLAKVKQYRSQLGMDSLLVKPISKSSATQRKGRAGREGPGKCFRLFTEKDYATLAGETVPEIQLCDLASVVLTMKARGADVFTFPFLTQPKTESLRSALLQLLRLQALEGEGKISRIGRQMAQFPLSAQMSRVLIAAAEPKMDCVLDVIDIVSCLSVENIFLALNTEDKKEEAEVARKELYKREGDHLTLLATIRGYASEQTDRRQWAERHFVSHRAMQNAMRVRKQLQGQCQAQKIIPRDADLESTERIQSAEHHEKILKCFLSGYAANVAFLMPDKSYRTFQGKQTVAIHPSSVLFGRKVEAIMYNELVFTAKSYARGVSAVQLNWYSEEVDQWTAWVDRCK